MSGYRPRVATQAKPRNHAADPGDPGRRALFVPQIESSQYPVTVPKSVGSVGSVGSCRTVEPISEAATLGRFWVDPGSVSLVTVAAIS
jgi:hypothetical protein